jgi:hypothetical protein
MSDEGSDIGSERDDPTVDAAPHLALGDPGKEALDLINPACAKGLIKNCSPDRNRYPTTSP